MSRRPIWEEIYKRFDPFRPAEDPTWWAERVRSPAGKIIQRVALPFADMRALVTGTTGTGKSTEMLRIAKARSGQDLVVVLDLQRHFSDVVLDEHALRKVSSWEVIFLAGLAIVRAANDILSHAPIPAAYVQDLGAAWERVAKATGAMPTDGVQVDVGLLSKAMIVTTSAAMPLLGVAATTAGAVGLTVLDGLAGALKWNIPLGQATRRKDDQDAEMQSLLRAVNLIIGYVQSKATRILLLVDGLDRITEIERAEALFIESELIPQLECRMVVSGPFALRSSPAASAVPRFNLVVPLVNEPVMDQDDPRKPGAGIAFFRELFQRRTADLAAPELVPPDLLDYLAYYSGGRARDFVKSIRMLAEQAWLDDMPIATRALADEVVDNARRLLETGLDRGHIRVFEQAMRDPQHFIPEDGKARELIAYGHLLPYPNESEWYYPHPLLTLHMLRPSAISQSDSG